MEVDVFVCCEVREEGEEKRKIRRWCVWEEEKWVRERKGGEGGEEEERRDNECKSRRKDR
jgi:hypothetical protein